MFTAGTLGDRMFGFGFPKLDSVVGEQHRNYRRGDNEGAHNASFRICTKEIEELTEPLRCNEEYMRAVREEIERVTVLTNSTILILTVMMNRTFVL